MEEGEKRLTVLQINKYKDESRELDKKAMINKWYIYGCAVVFIVCSRILSRQEMNSFLPMTIVSIFQYTGLGLGLDNLKEMIENLSKKAGLENMIEDLEFQLLLEKDKKNDEIKDASYENGFSL